MAATLSESWDIDDKPFVVQCSYTSPLCHNVITSEDYEDVVYHPTLLSSLLVLDWKDSLAQPGSASSSQAGAMIAQIT